MDRHRFLSRTARFRRRIFRVDGKCVVQILSVGRQTVLPPTVHPDTQKPYYWLDAHSLDSTSLENLPELPADYVERIKGIIEQARMVLDVEEERKPAPPEGHDEGCPFAALNNAAMRDLPKWVPDLNLYNWKQTSFRYPAYAAVASWRNSAHELDKRERNLKISSKGIVDFGDGQKGYSPINLVIAARGCDRSAAYDWLSERVFPKGPDVDFDKLVEKLKATASPSIDPDDDAADGADDNGGDGTDAEKDDFDFSLIGEAWEFGDPLPPQTPMLIPYFLPAHGFGYLGGEWGTYKTFVLHDMAVAVASVEGRFAGQLVKEQGAVIQVELEGSNSQVRIMAAAHARGVGERLPIALLRTEPPQIIVSKRLNPKFVAWCKELARFGKMFARKHGLPLRLISIDPQNRVAGFSNEQDSAEGQIVANAWIMLAKLAECTVIVADHYGKNAENGLKGTVAKETNALFILGTSPRDNDGDCYLEIRKMKNGQQGIAVDFTMEKYTVEAQQMVQGDDNVISFVEGQHDTLVVRWDDAPHPARESAKGEPKAKTQGEHCMDELRKLLSDPVVRVASGDAVGGYAVRTADWKSAAEGIGVSAARFYQIKSKLRVEGRIGENAEERVVWIALPTT